MSQDSLGLKFEYRPVGKDAKLLLAFKKIADELMDEELENYDFFNLIVSMGIRSMLKDLVLAVKTVDSESENILMRTIEQLLFCYPDEVCIFMVEQMKETLSQGRMDKLKEELRTSTPYK